MATPETPETREIVKNTAIAGEKTPRADQKRRPANRPQGWGGPRKGEGEHKKRELEKGKPGPGRGHFSVEGEARKEAQYRRVETLMGLLWDIAIGTDKDRSINATTRVQAASHLLDRIQGKPVQMVASLTTDDLSMMTDEELAADIERRGGKVRAFIEASMDEEVPDQSNRLHD